MYESTKLVLKLTSNDFPAVVENGREVEVLRLMDVMGGNSSPGDPNATA
jgi:hypothetical protein